MGDSVLTGAHPVFGHKLKKDFLFDDDWINVNHGSFGTYPQPIQTELRHWQDRFEGRVDQFVRYDYPKQLDVSRAATAKLLNAPLETISLMSNATTGVNTVFRNLTFAPGDKIVYFATIYGACEKTIAYITETTPAEAVKVEYTYPVSDTEMVHDFKKTVESEREKGANVKIAIFDTVVSMPGLRMPFEALTKACRDLGVLSLVDGAHAVGHVDLDLTKLDPDFLVSNLHKWLFVPRGCAVFYVPVRNQHLMRSTLPTSHYFIPAPKSGPAIVNPLPPSQGESPYITNFKFVGTVDNSNYLCVPAAIEYREKLGGEAAIREYCFSLARAGGKRVAEILKTRVLENPEGTLGECCFTNVELPLKLSEVQALADPKGVQKENVPSLVKIWASRVMVDEYNTFAALVEYADGWWVRLSAQVYLEMSDFEWTADILKKVSERVMKGEFLGA